MSTTVAYTTRSTDSEEIPVFLRQSRRTVSKIRIEFKSVVYEAKRFHPSSEHIARCRTWCSSLIIRAIGKVYATSVVDNEAIVRCEAWEDGQVGKTVYDHSRAGRSFDLRIRLWASSLHGRILGSDGSCRFRSNYGSSPTKKATYIES